MNQPFLSALKERPLLLDGAIGTLLYERGASPESCFEQLNITKQELIQQLHIDYINAGSDVIETNSFSGNRFRLAQHGLESKVWELNVWAAKLARNAREIAGQPTFVAGSIGPTGRLLAPLGDTQEREVEEAFREQMEGLLAGGVDLFIIESMSSIKELAIAVRVARTLSKLPVVAQFSFTVDGNTIMGVSPEDIPRLLTNFPDARPDVLGINCGCGPGPSLEFFKRLVTAVEKSAAKKEDLYFSCLPNAGLPSLSGGRFMYMSRPDYCASFIEPLLEGGARLIGGCCGTTPVHIKAMRQAMDRYVQQVKTGQAKADPKKAKQTEADAKLETSMSSASITVGDSWLGTASSSAVVEDMSAASSGDEPVALKDRLRKGKDFYVSVELDPPKGAIARKLLHAAGELKKAGADAINVGDSPMARVRMSCMATCKLIKDQVGIETIMHFTTRDRNLMGLQADLLGCQALGIKNILALTGDPPSVGKYAHATAVYDVDSIGLIKVISQLNEGMDIAGNSIGTPTSLTIACALNPTHENRQLEIERFRKKLDAGAHFVMTQPIYQLSDLTDFLNDFGECPVPILVGIMPLHSFKHAEYLHNEVPGISIPEHIRKAMEKAGDQGAEVGLVLAEELLEEIRPLAAGVYLVPSFGRHDDMCKLTQRIKLASTSVKAK